MHILENKYGGGYDEPFEGGVKQSLKIKQNGK
jgi:hypothetical protein